MSDAQPNTTPAPDTTPAPAGAPAGEEQELLDLHARDPSVFEFSPWKDTGRTGAERLVDLRNARPADKTDPTQLPEQPDTADADADVDDIDLDLDAPADDPEEDAGDGEAEAEEREALEPWSPPDGGEVSEVAKPHLATLDDIVSDPKLTAEQKRDGILEAYHELINDQRVRLAEADKVASKAAVEALGGKAAYAPLLDSAKAVLKSFPQELRDAVRDARTSDGRRLALMPEFVRALASMGERQANPQPQQNRTQMLQAELAELNAIRDRDITELHRPWKNTGMSGSDRTYQIMKELNGDGPRRPSVEDLRSEEAELMELYRTNQPIFDYAAWKDTGMTGAERLTRIRQGRA